MRVTALLFPYTGRDPVETNRRRNQQTPTAGYTHSTSGRLQFIVKIKCNKLLISNNTVLFKSCFQLGFKLTLRHTLTYEIEQYYNIASSWK